MLFFRLSLRLQPQEFKFKAVKSGAVELNGGALAVIGQNSISERLTDKFPFRRQRARSTYLPTQTPAFSVSPASQNCTAELSGKGDFLAVSVVLLV